MMKNLFKKFLGGIVAILGVTTVFALNYNWTSFFKVGNPITLPATQFVSGGVISGNYTSGGTLLMQVGESGSVYVYVPLLDGAGNAYSTGGGTNYRTLSGADIINNNTGNIFLTTSGGATQANAFRIVPQGVTYPGINDFDVTDATTNTLMGANIASQYAYIGAYGADTYALADVNLGKVQISAGSLTEILGYINLGNVVGINGSHVPGIELAVNGTVRLSGSSLACDSTGAGAIQYTGGEFYSCNGSSWINNSQLWTLSGTDIYKNNAGNVGIGVTSPTSQITMTGDLQFVKSSPYIKTPNFAANTSRLIFQSATATDDTNLSVFPGTSRSNTNILLSNSGANPAGSMNLWFGGGFSGAPTNAWAFGSMVNQQTTAGSLPIAFALSNATAGRFEAMRITNSGNVGIGLTAPTVPLHVAKTSQTLMTLDNNGTTITSGDILTLIGTPGAGMENRIHWKTSTVGGYIGVSREADVSFDMTFGVSSGGNAEKEAMRIDGITRNLGIGTTAPTATLQVSGTTILGTPLGNMRQTNGFTTRAGSGLAWNDIQNSYTFDTTVTANKPANTAISGSAIVTRCFDGGSTMNEIFGSIEIPHDMYNGTGAVLSPHVHMMSNTSAAETGVRYMDYTILKNGVTYGSTITTSGATFNMTGRQPKIIEIDGDIDATGIVLGDMISFRLYRDPTGADTYGGLMCLQQVGFHYIKDRLGSRNEYSN